MYAIYCWRDAPMRARALFEKLDDAHAWGTATFGADSWVQDLGDVLGDLDAARATCERLAGTESRANDAEARAVGLSEYLKEERWNVARLERELADVRADLRGERHPRLAGVP
jgi:hypothetical protein